MRRQWLSPFAAATAAALVALPVALVGGHTANPQRDRELITALSGSEEVPVGDPDGYGAAVISREKGNRICYQITAHNLDDVTAAHIHDGDAGENGDIVVTLFEGDVPLEPRSRKRCVRSTRAITRSIRRNPTGFYVNVHTQTFPNGAIRGQLSR
jgi:hypothetical protein